MERYPHQLSGGLLQRAAIATALSCGPELVIADEPTTALDALVQVQVIESFRRLVRELGTSLIVITHDLRLLERMADRIAAMYAGRIVEFGPARRLLARAAAPLPCRAPGVLRPGRRTGPAAAHHRRPAALAARHVRGLCLRAALPPCRRALLQRDARLSVARG